MAKYHLKDDGTPGVCRAAEGNCPKADVHFSTMNEARTAYEKNMEAELLSRFAKVKAPSPADMEFRERVARKRRVEDAILKSEPGKTVIPAPNNALTRTWDGHTKYGYYVHPDFRKALPDDEDLAAYIETVQLDDVLSEKEKRSATAIYDKAKGLFTYSYLAEKDYGPSYDAGYDD